MTEPTAADEARRDALTDKVIAMIEADPDPKQAATEVMSGLAGMVVAELGPTEGAAWLYQFADDCIEIESNIAEGKAP